MFKTFEEVERFFLKRKNLGIKPGLGRIKKLLALLDHPQKKMKAVHIAGTNGKGSTITFMKQALIYNRYKVGIFTSPSLDGLTGHIFLGNQQISEYDFMTILNHIYPFIVKLDHESNHPTEFEIITVIAFCFFANSVDIALIETGMGGKDDTTNCFQPILSVITTIDKDHTAFLGDQLTDIASHKAGIIKCRTPVIVGEMAKEAFQIIKKTAELNKAPLYKMGDQFTYHILEQSLEEQKFNFTFNDTVLGVRIKMLGNHQIDNCSVALMGLRLLNNSNFPIEFHTALKGMYETIIPGRLEVIWTNPTVILDGAHNPAGIKSFLNTVDHMYTNTKKELLFAAFKDKDTKQMLSLLTDHFSKITVTSFNHDRASSTRLLAKEIHNSDIMIEDDWKSYIDRLLLEGKGSNRHFFITGSLYFIALVKLYFENKPPL